LTASHQEYEAESEAAEEEAEEEPADELAEGSVPRLARSQVPLSRSRLHVPWVFFTQLLIVLLLIRWSLCGRGRP